MIRADRFTKRYGKFAAVQDISFEVKQGEVFAFLGPNGSGKTTTMKAFVGLNLPTSGRISINGLDVTQYPREIRRMLSYLPQRVVFPENLTAREILHFYADIRNIPRTVADEAINKARLRAETPHFGLPAFENSTRQAGVQARFNGFSNKYVGEFSGGMIQRLGLAVVSLPDVPILLLDEPTANLDPQGVKQFREFILEQKEQRKTIIFSTHLLAEAEQLADRVGIFVGGKLVAQESVENLHRSFVASGSTMEDLYLHYVGEYAK